MIFSRNCLLTLLKYVSTASLDEKNIWKNQLTEAVRFLHSLNLVWGDAGDHNIIIDEKTRDLIIFDFGGGISRNWVDNELYETKEGDLQAVSRLHAHIDGLKAYEVVQNEATAETDLSTDV